MLRPKQMSRVSVAGSKAVLEDVIEALHDLNLVHVVDYDGGEEGFVNGESLEGGDEISGKLVQVRAVINVLGVEGDDYDEEAGPDFGTRDELTERLEEVRVRVNELEDERNEVRDQLREAREEARAVEPFVPLGIDLDLLGGYDEIDLVVGEGDADEARAVVEEHTDEFEVFEGDGVVAVAARGVDLDDVLVGTQFSALDVPERTGAPEEILADVEDSIETLEAKLEELESELDELRDEHANFLLAAEEELSIEAQKTDAPLRFATTTNSFYAEGWIPAEAYSDMVSRLRGDAGERISVEELETVAYDENGHPHEEGDSEDGSSPPVVQDNPDVAKPFEFLVNTVNRPKYSELDPTLIVFLTFPFAFGFMIGDMGYGVLYMAMGAALYKGFDSDAMRALGIVAIWAGVFTFLFGYLYDDLFGVHLADVGIHLPLAGTFSKGIQTEEIALTWFVASVLFGILHLNIGHVFGFINNLSHGVKDAVFENVSWILVLNGFFAWVFSLHAAEVKPEFLVGETAVLFENDMFALGFAGFPAEVGIAALVAAGIGAAMLAYEEGVVGVIEMPAEAFGHVVSYLRIMAVLLAKGGMAFVVNLLVFGAYVEDGYINFALYAPPAESGAVEFPGLVWMGFEAGGAVLAIALIAAVLVFIIGHIIVLLLGITAAGIQMIRLEYVEFFGKFYEGGGDKFEPFGKQREYTNEGN